eukprot:CAMPEP_0180805294 /NCGR_PEP_ID=MMETSP1038_2-20121128/61936_1 /TAXON_ID=632150 /ORGANISM="Azadinium spinosum, Strain 3D9" /LENGTH=50 /DNA_ID=CAMNT_0022845831 /DNA_START=139 /DNA_END=287 /DNA_ORIENTATION=-
MTCFSSDTLQEVSAVTVQSRPAKLLIRSSTAKPVGTSMDGVCVRLTEARR